MAMYRCPGDGFYFCSLIKKTRALEKLADWNGKIHSAERGLEPWGKPANEVMPSRWDMSTAETRDWSTAIEL